MRKRWNITGYAIHTVAGTDSNINLNSDCGFTESKNSGWTKCIDKTNLETVRAVIEKTVQRAINKSNIDHEHGLIISLVVASNFFENVFWEQEKLTTVSAENYIICCLRESCHINGMILCNSTACSSGGSAIVTACHILDDNKSDVIIVLGYDMESEIPKCGMKRIGAISKDRIAPFSLGRTGTDLADGIGCLVIENNNSVMTRDKNIYASIIGYGVSCDGYNVTSPEPSGKALYKAMLKAINMSGIKLSQIGYVNAHGSGTILNDVLETRVIKKVFQQEAYNLLVNSSKSMIGHTLGAAGIIEAIITIMEMNTGIIHSTVNYIKKDEECDLNYCFEKKTNQDIKYAISNSIGFGGINVCLVLERGIRSV